MTASSLSRLPASVSGEFSLPQLIAWARLGGGAAIGVLIVLGAVVSGSAATFDPAPVLLFSVVIGAALGGRRGGVAAATVSSLAALVYFSQPAWVGSPGNAVRVLLLVASAGLTVALVGSLREAVDGVRRRGHNHPRLTDAVQRFASAIGEAHDDALLESIVGAGQRLVDADLVVLTVFDPRSGQHVIRAVAGTSPSAIGVEVLPGVGVTGQAIRDRRPVFAGAPRLTESPPTPIGVAARLTELLPSRRVHAGGLTDVPATIGATIPARPLATVPALHGGRVVATLTVARDSGKPAFDEHHRLTLDLIAPTLALTISNWMLRRQLREASIRDPLSGLYNRAYLDAALEQLLALRRRQSVEDRAPISIILFDIDDFRAFNDNHGRKAGDAVVRAIGAVLRQRFRASDLLGRVGGDGFLVVLDGAQTDVASTAAAEIRARVHSLALTDERGARVEPSISAGCATFSGDAERSEPMIRAVEAALDTARWSGPGAIVAI